VRPLHHAAASLLTAGAVYGVTKSPGLAALNFLCGVFIDLDHFPEYLIHHRFKRWPHQILKEEMHLTTEHTVLFFHGFDFAALVTAVVYVLFSPGAALAVGTAMFTHLLMDQYYNPIKDKWALFLLYRAVKKFKTKELYHRVDSKSWQEKRKEKPKGQGKP
jgi:hypothetical protein